MKILKTHHLKNLSQQHQPSLFDTSLDIFAKLAPSASALGIKITLSPENVVTVNRWHFSRSFDDHSAAFAFLRDMGVA